MASKDISNFYDDYTTKQKKTGVNVRHASILRRLKKAGLKPHHHVLEIGCGIGTATGLIASYVNRGAMVAVDISPKSIEIAREHYKNLKHVEFRVSDMSDFTDPKKFDFVVLPDVLEHIPVEQHTNLFRVIRAHMHENSFVAIHIPDPYYLEWVRVNRPETLQIIDQSLYSHELLPRVYANDLYLHSLERYGLYTVEPDYQWILLRPNAAYNYQLKSKRDLNLLQLQMKLGR